jgi:hypothetical protein
MDLLRIIKLNKFFTVSILLLTCALINQSYAQNFVRVTKGAIGTDTTNTNGASWVDYDGDGDLDLFLSNANVPYGFNTLYRNDGGDNFTRIERGEVTNLQTPTFGNSWADYDNDGYPDLFIVNAYTKMGSLMYKNNGDGTFQRNERFDPGRYNVLGFNSAWGDYDNDGLVDLIVTHPAKFVGMPITSNFLFHNDGNGYFSSVQSTPITQISAPFTNASWADYDLDGDIDLFIGSGPANGTVAPDFLYKNLLKESGKSTFSRMNKETFTKDSLDGQVWNFIDYDNDSDLDTYITNWGGTFGGLKNNFYRNDGGPDSSRYVRITKGDFVEDKGISLANVWADFDNDGDLDLYVGNGRQANRYYKNNGDGTFTTITKGLFVEEVKNTWGVTFGDYDNDGDLDLFVSNKTTYVKGGETNNLFRNDLDNGNNWITIKLIGEKSNRSAIGTIVKATAKINSKEVTQLRVVGSQVTFLGQNDLRVHFGLGDAEKIDKIEFNWSSGQQDVFTGVKPNKFYTLTEGMNLIMSK